MKTTLSERAQLLYDWMVEHREQVVVGDRIEFHCSVSASPEVISELKQSGMIKGTHRPDVWVVGVGTIHFVPFGKTIDIREQLSLLWQRYSQHEKAIIEQAFQSFAQRRGREKMTDLQMREELHYYLRYPVQVVMKGLKTFICLPTHQQFSPEYARGIIRNESLVVETPPPFTTSKTPQIFSGQKSKEVVKQQWIKRRLQAVDFVHMSLEEKEKTLASLDEEFAKISEEELSGMGT